MLQKPVIYVSRITNLSDARYCAGMGVDMLGFVIDPDHPDYVSPAQYQEMAGWISGPKRVIEISSTEKVDFDKVVDFYKPDFIHASLNERNGRVPSNVPWILEVPLEDLASYKGRIQNTLTKLDYILVAPLPASAHWNLANFKCDHPVLLSLGDQIISIADLQKQTGVAGFAMQGSRELSPGLKDYDHLSRILEELDR